MRSANKSDESQNPDTGAGGLRVLCYSPYNLWTLHGLWEMTILHALKLRGANVQYVLCDGLYSECDVFWAATNPRHDRSCAQCQTHVTNLVHGMSMPYEWLGRYLLPSEFQEARRWVSLLDPHDLLTASYGEWSIGQWVEGSVHSHFRLSHLDLNDPVIQDGYRSYLYSGLVACFGLSRLLDDYRPNVLFLFNGRQSSTRVAFELARRRGVRVVCHERGLLSESMSLVENAGAIALHPIKQIWREWGDVPLRKTELNAISQYMLDRADGKNLSWRAFSPPPQILDVVYQELGLLRDRPVWVLFTSSDDEVVAASDWAGPFARQMDWIQRTIEYVRQHPEIDLVIRVHPNTAGKRATGNNVTQLREMAQLRSNVPNNVRIVMPDDPISSYSLMDIASLGLVYQSTVGLEMACKSKSVVVASGSYISDLPFVTTVGAAEEYEAVLDRMLDLPLMAASTEVQRMAYRFAYGLFFRWNIPFPLVTMPNPHQGRLAYDSLICLLPGREPNLDRICRIILDGEPVCLPPSDEDRMRSEGEEAEWFERQANRKALSPLVPTGESTQACSTDNRRQEASRDGDSHSVKLLKPECHQEKPRRVSVIIPCFNYAHYLAETVRSVLAQTYQDFEIIIVNDGSTDNTQEVAEQLIATHQSHQIRLINQANSGQPAIARNRGISETQGEYILCLDADDMLMPAMLRECVRLLDDNPDISIAYPDYIGTDMRQKVVWAKTIEYDLSLLSQRNLMGYCSLYRRRAWKDVGGYRTNVRGYEDWDFWIACGAMGHVGKRIAKPLFLYRLHGGGLYSEAVTHDLHLKAQIVLNQPQLYKEDTIASAKAMILGTEAQTVVLEAHAANGPQALGEAPTCITSPVSEQPPWPEEVMAQVRLADEQFGQGDLKAAGESLRQALTIQPDDPQLILAYGNVILRLGDVEAARREFVKATTLHPTHAPAHLNLAAVLVMLERRDEAECSVRQALTLNPNDVDALKLLGRICLESGRHVEGVQTYTDALRQSPDDVEALLALGKCAVEASDLAGAQTLYERARKLAPNNDLARENLEIVRERMKADVGVVHDPVGASIIHSSETACGEEGRQSKALETKPSVHYGSVLAISESTLRAPMVSVIVPTYNRPDTLLDALRSILNQTYQDFEIIVVNDAGSDVENIVRFLDKDDRITYIRHGSNRNLAAARNTGIRVARGKYIAYLDDDDLYHPDHLQTLVTFLEQSECKVAYTDAYRAHQEKRDGRYVVTKRDIPYSFDFDYDRILVHNFVPVLCFMHERACLDAVGLFDESLTTHEDWELWIRLSRRFQFAHIKKVTCEFASRIDGSTMSSSKLADFRRTYAIILERYKASAVEKPHIRAAQERLLQSMREKTASTAVATQPAWPVEVIEQVRQAEQHLVQGDPPAAAQALSQALQLVPHDPELIVAYGNILLRVGDVEAARREFVKATVLAPEYVPAHSNLAAVLLHLGRAEDAEASARQALALNPADTDSLKVLARVCLDGERFAEAVQAYVAVLRLHPDDVETLLVVGNCYAEAGRPEDATTFYQRVLQLDPGNAVAAENLAAISGNRDASDSATLRADRPSEDPRALSGARSISHEPIASIVIVTYNSASTIRACMESVFSSTRSPIELIVVDNASTDATRAVLAEYQGRIATLLNAENAGFSRGCNQGIRASSGEYVVLLNPDTVVTYGWLERMKAHFGQDIGAVGPVSDFVAGLQKISRHLPDGAPKRMGLGEVTDLLARVNHGKGLQTKLLIGFCMMIPRRVIGEIGLLDEALFLGNDDLDLSWRLRERGYRLVVATDTFVHHKGQVSFKSAPSEQTSMLVQESTDRLYAKLEAHYGKGSVPPPMELWGIDWFRPSHAHFRPQASSPVQGLTSIIILVFNGLEHTIDCLKSLNAYTPEPHEIIVVDNGSTDGTVDYLRRYSVKHENIRVIANSSNKGFAAGNNQGLSIARGEYLLLLNNDTMVTSGWLKGMLKLFKQHQDVGIAGPMSNHALEPQLVPDAKYQSIPQMEAFAAKWSADHAGQSLPVKRVVGFCLMTTRRVIDLIGGLDERFGSGNFEDDDLCRRAALAGFQARIAQDVYIHHTGGQTFKIAGIDYSQSLHRNWELFKAKWGIPTDAPYGKGYRFPSQIPQGSDLSIPLPDVGADHRCEDQGRWWQEISECPVRSQPAVTEEAPLSVIIVPNGYGLAPLWPSLVQHTKHPLAITILPSHGNGNGDDPAHEVTCPDGWRISTSDLSAVRLFNQLLQSAHDDPVILLSSDLILTPGWLKRLLAALKRDQCRAAVGPTSNGGAAPQRIKAEYKGTGKSLRQFALRRAHRYGEELAEVNGLAPFCIVFKGSACRSIGPLREDLDLSASLYDYFARLRQAGRKVAVILDTYAHYEPHADLLSMGARRADADP